MVNSEGKGPADVEDELRDLNDLKGQTQNPCTGTRIDDLLCLDTPATITAGTETFGFGPNKKMYINHYEVIITAGMAAKGEGLLYLPLVKARIPVEWSGLQVNRSQTGDYGCVLAPGQIQMQGSQSGVISGDLFRQVMALLTQGPGSFSGKFGEAVKLISQQGDSLQRGQTINWALAKGALEASKDGFEKWRTETQNYFTKEGGSLPQEVQTILSQMQATQDKLSALSTCVVQNIPPSSSKKSVFPTHVFFACELTAADIAKMKGLEAEMEEMQKELEGIIYIHYTILAVEPTLAQQINDRTIPYGNFGSIGTSKKGEDWNNVGNNLKPITTKGIDQFALIVTNWIYNPTDYCPGGHCNETWNTKFKELKSSLICPLNIDNSFLFNKMAFPFELVGALNWWRAENYPQMILNRYRENQRSDYYFPIAIEQLVFESDKGKTMIRNIVKAFHQTIKEKGVNYEGTLNDRFNDAPRLIEDRIYTPSFKIEDGGVLFALMGGTQHIRVLVSDFNLGNGKYSANMYVQLMDDFGANENDWAEKFDKISMEWNDLLNLAMNSATFGKAKEALLAFWLLQNQRNQQPFRTVNTFKITLDNVSIQAKAK